MKKIHVRATFIEPVLGTAPNDKEIYENFIGSKAPDAATLEEEVAAVGVEEVASKGKTVFPKLEDGTPFIWDYQLKGFMKDACGMLSRIGGKDENGKKRKVNESSKMTAFKKVIDGLIYVFPRAIPFQLANENINDSIRDCQRPLRAQTMQGERVTLANSEEIPAGSFIEFDVQCLADENMNAVIEWLEYGILRGIGQWRNSGKGRFTYELLDDDGNVIGQNKGLFNC